jgi:hypothetical protein
MHRRRVPLRAALALLLAASCAQAAEKQGRWRLRFGLDLSHDSNVLELSRADRQRAGDPAQRAHFGLASADDFITSPRLALSWARNLLKRRSTEVTAGWDGALYSANPRLNTQAWSLDVSQELGKERRATTSSIDLSLAHAEDVTLKRIVDDDVTLEQGVVVRADQEYDRDSVGLGGTIELIPRRLALDVDATREQRNYVATFRERDGHSDAWRARLVGYPGGRFRVRGGWSGESYEARGDDKATPLVEDDISSRRDGYTLDVRAEWGRKGARQRADVGWDQERRLFRAESPYDFYHHGRRDVRTTWSFAWRRSLPHDLALEADVDDEANATSFAEPPPLALPADEVTSYHATRVTVALSWRLDLRPRKRAGAGSAMR